MKKLLFFFAHISLLFLGVEIQAQNVYIENGQFKLNGNDFFPLTSNYIANIVKVANKYQARPEHAYGHFNTYECNSESDCLNEIRNHFQLLKDLGFNSVRLCGFSVGEFESNGKLCLAAISNPELSYMPKEELTPPYFEYLTALSNVVNIAEEVGLKIVLLCGIGNSVADPLPEDPKHRKNAPITIIDKYSNFLDHVAAFFSTNTTIMAFDLCNEPAYNNSLGDNKETICQIVTNWINIIKSKSQNHLVTIGYAGSSEVFGWDPSILPVDFASFHPYPKFNPMNINSVEIEIYWYKNFIKIPWIIGETGSSNHVETPTFDEQFDYAEKSLKRVKNCFGDGYSWWEFSDKPGWGGNYNSYAYGILNNSGYSFTSTGNEIQGTIQPFAYVFDDLMNNFSPNFDCPCLWNYFNEYGFDKHIISGVVKDDISNKPIEGAVVYGWDDTWKCYTTKTNSNGIFNLYSDTKIRNDYDYGPKVSALGMSIKRYKYGGDTLPIVIENKTLGIGSSETFKTSSYISCKNYLVQGNGVSGGNAFISGGDRIIFENGFKVENGGKLVAEAKTDYGEIKLSKINACINSKSVKSEPENYLSEFDKENKGILYTLYPNPTNGVLNVQTNEEENVTIELFDTYGKKVYSKVIIDQFSVLDISSLSSGIYVLKLTTSNGFEFRKIIRQ